MNANIIKATTEKRVQLGEVLPLEVPFTLEIFPTNVCNFKCKYCAHSNKSIKQKNEFMEFDVFKKSIDGLQGFQQKLKLLLFAGLGEPLLHPQISEMISYAKKASVAETIRIITNASMLTPEISDKLIEAGLDHLKISIQGLTNDKYKEMCSSNISLQTIIENIKYFYNNKRDTVVNIKIVADAFDNKEDEKVFYEMFGNICDCINIEHISAYQETDYSKLDINKHVSQTGMSQGNRLCQIPFYFYSVYPDGEIIPCCLLSFEKYKKFSLGNVNEKKLSEVWNSKEFNKFRLMLLEDRRKENSVCSECEELFKSQCQPGDNIDPYAQELILKYKKLINN